MSEAGGNESVTITLDRYEELRKVQENLEKTRQELHEVKKERDKRENEMAYQFTSLVQYMADYVNGTHVRKDNSLNNDIDEYKYPAEKGVHEFNKNPNFTFKFDIHSNKTQRILFPKKK